MNVQEKIEVITKSYSYLVHTLPISNGEIISSLFREGVITFATQRQIRNEPLESKQVMLLLDTVILKSLRLGVDTLYDKLATVLAKSKEPIAEKLGRGLKNGNMKGERPSAPVPITYDAGNAKRAITNMYSELLVGIPIELLIPELVEKGVIPHSEKASIDAKETSVAKTTYLLDQRIIRGLRLGLQKPFETFLDIMEECDDMIANNLAHKLKTKCGIVHLPQEVTISPEEEEVSSGLEKYLKDSVKKGSACYRAKEPWVYAVCRITNKKEPLGSGFVGTLTTDKGTITVLVTNNHVFQRLEQAREADYEFGYLDHGEEQNFIKGKILISESAMFYTDHCKYRPNCEWLDYFVVQVNDDEKEHPLRDTKFRSKLDGKMYSIDDCKLDLDKHVKFDSSDCNAVISIYHHPQGRTLRKSSQMSKRCDYLLFYLCDTEPGSSGSPIVKTTDDQQRQVIGLHRGYYKIGNVIYNYGSTMSAIVCHIHGKFPNYFTENDLPESLSQNNVQ